MEIPDALKQELEAHRGSLGDHDEETIEEVIADIEALDDPTSEQTAEMLRILYKTDR
jgi:hypothetical protein